MRVHVGGIFAFITLDPLKAVENGQGGIEVPRGTLHVTHRNAFPIRKRFSRNRTDGHTSPLQGRNFGHSSHTMPWLFQSGSPLACPQ